MTLTGERGTPKAFIVFMTLLFALMLISSLWHRFLHPDLVIRKLNDHGHAQSGMDDNVAAIGQLMQRVGKNPQDLEATLKLVESLMAIGEWQSAENFAQKTLSLSAANPDEIRPLYLLSFIHHNLGRHEQAAELLEKVLEKQDNPSARYNLGILYTHYLGHPEKGVEQFRKALRHDGLAAGLRAAIKEELDKITAVLPQEDAASLARPLEDDPVKVPDNK